ncbi:hypothetical protein DRN41_07950, partial [Thermococci archaeon]
MCEKRITELVRVEKEKSREGRLSHQKVSDFAVLFLLTVSILTSGFVSAFSFPDLFILKSHQEPQITILNPQSYPEINKNWTVSFSTRGTGDLTITAVNGTKFDRDLRFLEIRCGNQTLSYEWINNSLFLPDYSCNSTSYEISKVLTSGKHTLEFKFGSIVKYAHNTVTSINLNSPANQTHFDIDTENQPNFNFTAISNTNTTFSCELFIDDTSYGSNSSVQNNTATIIQANSPLSLGEYNWYINCTDSSGTTKSEVRTFYMENISVSLNLDKTIANPGQNITISGRAILQPDGTNVTNNTISIWLDGNLLIGCPNQDPNDACWNLSSQGWLYRKPLTIQNQAGNLT